MNNADRPDRRSAATSRRRRVTSAPAPARSPSRPARRRRGGRSCGSGSSDALTISDSVQPMASTAPKNPAADRRHVGQPLAEQRHVHVDHRGRHQQPERDVHPLQRTGPECRSAATPSPAPAGRPPGTARPVPRRRRAARTWHAAVRWTPATLIASAAAPSSSSDHTGIRGIARGHRLALLPGRQRDRHQRRHRHRHDRQRAESPTPDTELGEHAAHGGTDDHAHTPHRRHQRRRPGPQPVAAARS